MNNKKHKITFLTGWGFKSSVWSHSVIPAKAGIQKSSIKAIDSRFRRNDGGKSILIAWSLGGLYAIDLAYRFPERYQKIIFISSLPKFVSDKKNHWRGISRKKAVNFYHQSKSDLAKLINNFLDWVQYPDDSLDIKNKLKNHILDINKSYNQKYLRKSLKVLFQKDYRERYQQLHQDIFHIFGDHDAIMPVNKITKQLKGKIYVIPGAGHSPFLTNPDSFLNILCEILYDKYI